MSFKDPKVTQHSLFSGHSLSIQPTPPATDQTQGPPTGQLHVKMRCDLLQPIVQEKTKFNISYAGKDRVTASLYLKEQEWFHCDVAETGSSEVTDLYSDKGQLGGSSSSSCDRLLLSVVLALARPGGTGGSVCWTIAGVRHRRGRWFMSSWPLQESKHLEMVTLGTHAWRCPGVPITQDRTLQSSVVLMAQGSCMSKWHRSPWLLYNFLSLKLHLPKALWGSLK